MTATVPDTAPVSDAELRARSARRPPASNRARRAWLVAAVAALAWSVIAAGVGRRPTLNPSGFSQVADFFAAAARPELSGSFLRLTVEATVTTVAYAVLGTALAMIIGLAGGVVLSVSWWRDGAGRWPWRWRPAWFALRGGVAAPRGVHEAVWGLFLVNVLGLDPLVAVLAIGIPFGVMTAKVVADLVDDAAGGSFRVLRAAGARRGTATAYGVLPTIAPDIASYGFYRLECAIRAAAILGIIGAGGLGFQLALSFSALQYHEMWTLLYALALASGLADLWSGRLRRRAAGRSGLPVGSVAALGVLVIAAWVHLEVDLSTLWAPRAHDLLDRIVTDSVPPTIGPGGTGELVRLAAETLQMSVLAIALAVAIAVPAAFAAARGRRGSLAVRALLLLARAIPPPVWALMALFALRPGVVPGAVALGLYNAGILGRLMAEVVENLDARPARALRAAGVPDASAFLYGVLPQALPRFASYALYRWEVAARETVVVGLVGAGGLGRRLGQQVAAFNFAGALTTIAALIAVTFLVDLVSAAIRPAVR